MALGLSDAETLEGATLLLLLELLVRSMSLCDTRGPPAPPAPVAATAAAGTGDEDD